MNQYTEIDGIRCYAPEFAKSNKDYPSGHFKKLFALESNHFWFRSRNRIISKLVKKYLGNKTKFLEIGCGTAFVLNGIAKKLPQLELSGAEIHLDGLKQARERLPNADFIQLDARNLPFKNSFDAIGAFDVIEHITEDEDVLKSVHTALTKNGHLFLTVPQHKWLWSTTDEAAFHKRRYTRKELTDKVTQAGFTVLFVTSFVSTLLPLMLASRLRKQKKTHSQIEGMEYSYDELKLPYWLNFILEQFMRIDELLINLKISLPFGGSLALVAKKRIISGDA